MRTIDQVKAAAINDMMKSLKGLYQFKLAVFSIDGHWNDHEQSIRDLITPFVNAIIDGEVEKYGKERLEGYLNGPYGERLFAVLENHISASLFPVYRDADLVKQRKIREGNTDDLFDALKSGGELIFRNELEAAASIHSSIERFRLNVLHERDEVSDSISSQIRRRSIKASYESASGAGRDEAAEIAAKRVREEEAKIGEAIMRAGRVETPTLSTIAGVPKPERKNTMEREESKIAPVDLGRAVTGGARTLLSRSSISGVPLIERKQMSVMENPGTIPARKKLADTSRASEVIVQPSVSTGAVTNVKAAAIQSPAVDIERPVIKNPAVDAAPDLARRTAMDPIVSSSIDKSAVDFVRRPDDRAIEREDSVIIEDSQPKLISRRDKTTKTLGATAAIPVMTDPEQAKRAVEELQNKAAQVIQRKFKERKAVRRKPLEISTTGLAAMTSLEEDGELLRHESAVSSVAAKIPTPKVEILDVTKVAGLESNIRKLKAELKKSEFEDVIMNSFILAAENGNFVSLGVIDKNSGFTKEERANLAIQAFERAATKGNYRSATYLEGMVPEPFKGLMRDCAEGKEGALDLFRKAAVAKGIDIGAAAETLSDDSVSMSSGRSESLSVIREVSRLLSNSDVTHVTMEDTPTIIRRDEGNKGR
jgi:hypothetical protein